ncbi:tigger transposable element-derived 6-like [Brachionus plicatilis]|uniref:Tigger transposable element-derived 6-like n=1 Tax=Brachionus plicatilis TaxID=10195 RepID=A0A3M7QK57_BRAPC|nr:tigger transposable element-derived 6-like [Brachionus plicatilis]
MLGRSEFKADFFDLLQKYENYNQSPDLHLTCDFNGWLCKFKERNGISLKTTIGEALEFVQNWILSVLPDLIKDYAVDDIFNANETTLIYKALPNKANEDFSNIVDFLFNIENICWDPYKRPLTGQNFQKP